MRFPILTLTLQKIFLPCILLSFFLGISFTGISQVEEHDPRGGGGLSGTDFKPPKNGDGVLGPLYSHTACGLNYSVVSRKLGQRFDPPGEPQPATVPIVVIPCAATSSNVNVLKSYVWCSTSGNGAAFSITVVNPSGASAVFPMTLIGSGPDKCWGYNGAYTYRAEVTSIVTQTGNYMISGFPTNTGFPVTNDTDGMSMMVIYTDPSATYRGTIILEDGNITKLGEAGNHTITMPAVCGPTTNAKVFCAIGDVQMDIGLTMNGTATPVTPDWWNYIETGTPITSGQTTADFSIIGSGDCYTVAMAGLYYRTTCVACTPPPPPDPILLSAAATPDSCGNCSGTVTVTPSGPAGPFTYVWSPSSAGTDSTAGNLCAGNYTVTVGTPGGCVTNTTTVTVAPGDVVTIHDSINPVVCHNEHNGSVFLDITGQRGPYVYAWSPMGQTTDDITNLPAGTYTITITDTIGCETVEPYVVHEPDSLRAPMTVTVTCNGINGGSMSVAPAGGVAPYTYLWSTGSSNDTITGLSSGTYYVTVTDANNCTTTDTAVLDQPALLEIDLSAPDSLLCMGESANLGTVVLGGTGTHTYAWSEGLPADDAHTVTPTVTTIYKVTVRDSHNCVDKDSVKVVVSPMPMPEFTFSNECIGILNEFTNLSTVATGTMSYSWNFGDGSMLETTQDAARLYTTIGTYPVKLIVTTDMQCVDSVLHPVIIHAIPVVNFEADDVDGCAGHCVNFTDLTTVANSTITAWEWTADGIPFSDVMNPLQCFPVAGRYTINLKATSAGGCAASASIVDYLTIFPFPVADFEMSANEVTIYNTYIRFNDESQGAVSWDWDLGDGDSTTETVFGHYYQDSGYYCIELQATSIDGCVDTVIKCLLVRDQTTIYVPNSFTPDGDEFNQTFMAKGTSFREFRMTIYNRWGQVIFESNDINVGWDGTIGESGAKCPMGMYIYRIDLMDANQTRQEITGHLTLIRL